MSILNRVTSLCSLIGSVLLLASCGGGNSDLPPERPETSIGGYAVDALVRSGTISVYDFSGGSKGELLGTATTDIDGYYELSIRSPSKPVLLELRGGSYIEERSGRTVTLSESHFMKALTYYQEETPLSVMVTPFTTIATGLAEYKIENGENVQNAIIAASTAITSIYGIDILGTYPINITDPANLTLVLDDGYRYGFLAAAISSWTYDVGITNGDQPHNIYKSIDLVDLMYDDVRSDGLLDGNKSVGGNMIPISMGTVVFDANVYRNGFATHLLTLSDRADINKTGLGVPHLLSYATTIATSGHEMFSGLQPVPIDSIGPTISPMEAEGALHNATFTYSVAVDDFVGVQGVEFFIDSVSLGDVADTANPSVQINTTLYGDGDHMVGVRAVDSLGNDSYQEFLVKFSNTAPVIAVSSERHTNNTAYDISGTWSVNAGDEPTISVTDYLGTRYATVNSDGSWDAVIHLQNGNNVIDFEIMDSLTNSTQITDVFALDLIPPRYSLDAAGNTRYQVSGTVFTDSLTSLDTYQVIYQTTDKLALNGLPADSRIALSEALIPAWLIRPVDPVFEGVRTEQEDLLVELRYIKGSVIQKDWTQLDPIMPSNVNYIVSLTEESLTEDWHQTELGEKHLIIVRFTDRAGNSTELEIEFEVVIYPVEPVVSVEFSDFTEGVVWESRATLHNTAHDTVSYSWTNETGYDYYISVQDTGSHKVISTVDTAIREHKARPVEIEERRIMAGRDTNYFGSSFDLTYYDHYTDLTSVAFYNWDGSAWVSVSPKDKVYGGYTDLSSDYFPEQATNWLPWHVDSAFKPPADPSCSIIGCDEGVPYSLDYRTCLSECSLFGPIASYGYVEGDGAYGNTLQRRTVNTLESMPGHPHNITDSFTESVGGMASSFVVYVDDEPAPIINGYTEVPVGSTVSIRKIIYTPNTPVYDDVDVENLSTFNSYTLRKYDRSISWTIDMGAEISVAHSVNQFEAADVSNLVLKIPSDSVDIVLSR